MMAITTEIQDFMKQISSNEENKKHILTSHKIKDDIIYIQKKIFSIIRTISSNDDHKIQLQGLLRELEEQEKKYNTHIKNFFNVNNASGGNTSGRNAYKEYTPFSNKIVCINKNTMTEDDKECTICINSINKTENCIKLDCHHYFHIECFYPWFKGNNTTCPNCRNCFIKDFN